MNILFMRIAMMTVGLTMIGLSIALLQIAALGTDPYSLMTIGLSETMGISFGSLLFMINLLLFVVILWKKRELVGLGTVVSMIGIGYTADFFHMIFTGLGYVDFSFWIRVLLMAITILLFSLAAALYMTANLGIAPYDAVALLIESSTKQKISFKWARIFTDSVCVLVGFLFGATIGLATFIIAFLMGPLVNFFRNYFASWL